MKTYIRKTFETTFEFEPGEETLIEVDATYDYTNDKLDIDYVYNLETAQYITNYETMTRTWKFKQDIIGTLTRFGETTDYGFYN
jgi:hypothetical protein